MSKKREQKKKQHGKTDEDRLEKINVLLMHCNILKMREILCPDIDDFLKKIKIKNMFYLLIFAKSF